MVLWSYWRYHHQSLCTFNFVKRNTQLENNSHLYYHHRNMHKNVNGSILFSILGITLKCLCDLVAGDLWKETVWPMGWLQNNTFSTKFLWLLVISNTYLTRWFYSKWPRKSWKILWHFECWAARWTHQGWVMHTCLSKINNHWFR